MLLTRAQASETWCPMVKSARANIVDAAGFDDHQCVADRCAMWRWTNSVAAIFVPRDQRTWWPFQNTDAAVELMRKTEPPRHAKVPADAVWVPVTGLGDNIEGGFWEEPIAKVAADNAAARATAEATMQGFCGLAGRPA